MDHDDRQVGIQQVEDILMVGIQQEGIHEELVEGMRTPGEDMHQELGGMHQVVGDIHQVPEDILEVHLGMGNTQRGIHVHNHPYHVSSERKNPCHLCLVHHACPSHLPFFFARICSALDNLLLLILFFFLL